jgi:hypothetical protein
MAKKYTYEEVFEAHFKARGRMGDTCKLLNIERTTIYGWMERDPVVGKALEDAKEAIKDHWEKIIKHKAEGRPQYDSEGNIIGFEVEPDIQALRILLRAKASDRGYGVSTTKIDVPEGTEIHIERKVVTRESLGTSDQTTA